MSAADLDAALGMVQRILVDSSTLIAAHSSTERVHALAAHLFRRVEQEADPLRAFYSVDSAVELLVRPIRSGPQRFAFMHDFLMNYPNLTALPVDLQVAIQAANLRATAGIALPDALIVASGLLAGCEAIVTNDERWKRRFQPLLPRFRWIYLGDYL